MVKVIGALPSTANLNTCSAGFADHIAAVGSRQSSSYDILGRDGANRSSVDVLDVDAHAAILFPSSEHDLASVGEKVGFPSGDKRARRQRRCRSRAGRHEDPVLTGADRGFQHPLSVRREIFAKAIAQPDGVGAIGFAQVDGPLRSRRL